MITAPYNFVPLNKEVFYPSWSEEVSHDVPFKDGESGEIDITITAKSPIFIRDHENSEQFCQHDGQYYIPSSSVKGMVRNVLEIMSFSKMSAENFDDATYAIRDLSGAKFYMDEMKKVTFGGWLKKIDGKYFIEDCGEVGRISHEEIDKALSIEFARHFKEDNFGKKNQEEKSSKYKYDLIKNKNTIIKLSKLPDTRYGKKVFKYEENGENQATLVLTGQPTPRKDSGKQGDGKGFEFLFFKSGDDIDVPEEVIKNFKFAYFDGRKTEPKESPDWDFWKKKLEKGEKVPVFFQKNGTKLKHFGLSYLYKLPYKYSVKDGIPKSHFKSEKLDLAQTIFGYISKNNKQALKGRVQFSHFKATENASLLKSRTEILGTPRASYYPIYVRQQGRTYKTFMDEDFEISGRKRYPIHKSNEPAKTKDTGNSNVGTPFNPLNHGVVFKGKLRYHNLKKCEIGAILSVLTFHNTPNTFHNIGMAKSLGYGKIEIKVNEIADVNSYLKEFEFEIEKQIKDWASSKQLQELLSMATEQDNQGDSKLIYMELKEFAKNKTRKDIKYLGSYTSLNGIKKIKMKNLLSKDEKALKEKLQEQQKEYDSTILSENPQTIKSFLEKYPEHPNKIQLQTKIDKLEATKEQNKSVKIYKQAKESFDKVMNQEKKDIKKKYLKAWIEKWEKKKNNKDISSILELVEKAKL